MKKVLALFISFLLLLTFIPVHAASINPTTIQMTVVFKNNSISTNVKNEVLKAGGKVLVEIPQVGVMKIEGKSTLLQTLQSNSDVQAIAPTIEYKLPVSEMQVLNETTNGAPVVNDLYQKYQWDIKQMTNNGDSFKLATGSHNTVVGIIDTGVSTKHPDLMANLLGGQNFVPDGPNGTVVPSDIEDRNGHGSHVAGNIAGNGRILGIAPDMGYRAYRVFGATGGSPSDRILNAIIAAVNDKVDVISMSLSGFDVIGQVYYTDPATGVKTKLGDDLADFVAYNRTLQYAASKGVIVVAAAGNDSLNISNKLGVTEWLNNEYKEEGLSFVGAGFLVPGTLPGVITVSATGPDRTLATYSNYGAGSIDVTAPGGDSKRYPAAGWFTDLCLSAYMDGGYVFMAGTSMATPKVAATVALMIDQSKASGRFFIPKLVESKLYLGAEDQGKPGYDEEFGFGFVNVVKELTR